MKAVTLHSLEKAQTAPPYLHWRSSQFVSGKLSKWWNKRSLSFRVDMEETGVYNGHASCDFLG